MLRKLILIPCIVFTLYFITILNYNNVEVAETENAIIATPLLNTWDLPWEFLGNNSIWNLGTSCGQITYEIYKNLSFINVAVFIIKLISTGLCAFKCLKVILMSSLARIKQKQMELEQLKLQVEIVNTKLGVCDTEYRERMEQLRVEAEKLSRLRARVRDVIAQDDTLKKTLDEAMNFFEDEPDIVHTSPDTERKSIEELLKEVKLNHLIMPDYQKENLEDYFDEENSVYTSLSDSEITNDCRVKIVKVTNVYKVAYLKHYIKQKRLRRANNQAILKKKMENIKKLLDDWQKTLSVAINTKLSTLNDSQADLLSQDAMGDYSKPNLQELSDEGSVHDVFYDDFSNSWCQNPYRNFSSNYEGDVSTPDQMTREEYENTVYPELSSSYPHPRHDNRYEHNGLFMLPEETSSQIAIEEIKSTTPAECGDLITLE